MDHEKYELEGENHLCLNASWLNVNLREDYFVKSQTLI